MFETKCQRCGDDTNFPPDDMPVEYRGYCPECVVAQCEAGLLPMPTPEAMLNYITTAIANQVMEGLMGKVEIQVVNLSQPKSPSEIVVTPAGPVQYSQN